MNNYKLVLTNGEEVYFSSKFVQRTNDSNVIKISSGFMVFDYDIVTCIQLNKNTTNKSTDDTTATKDNKLKDLVMSNPEEYLPLLYERLYNLALEKKMLKEAVNIRYIMSNRHMMYERRFADKVLNKKNDEQVIKEISYVADSIKAVFGNYKF
jgi:hypothetical protein